MKLSELEAAARAATPGEREAIRSNRTPEWFIVARDGSTPAVVYWREAKAAQCDADAAFIAAANPATILKLIEAVRAARAVAFSNGFDAALPDKQAALREALKGIE